MGRWAMGHGYLNGKWNHADGRGDTLT